MTMTDPPISDDRLVRDLTLLSVVAPIYNEEALIDEFYARACTALEGLKFELVLVDDGSTDGSAAVLERLAANDPRVHQAEADQIVKAMQAKSIPVTYVLFPDEGHGFARPENRISFYAITENFLSKCLGGRAEEMTAFPGAKITVPQGAEGVPGLAQVVGRS